jgi:dTDP-4-dehydrorhamnose 3,5-epimerase
MRIEALALDGVHLVRLEPRHDERGHFARVYDNEIMERHGLHREWLQENEALSTRRHTLRGLHYQRPPSSETKLVRCAVGRIWDVFVDLRAGSPDYGKWGAVELDAERPAMLFLPAGFAHGYLTLTETTLVAYKVDARYAPEHEGRLRWDDPAIGIDWPTRTPLLSPLDAAALPLEAHAPLVIARAVAA